jgi:hypothetical protein
MPAACTALLAAPCCTARPSPPPPPRSPPAADLRPPPPAPQCNQFGAQEPGSNSQIKSFAASNYGVKFPLFAKVDVNGSGGARAAVCAPGRPRQPPRQRARSADDPPSAPSSQPTPCLTFSRTRRAASWATTSSGTSVGGAARAPAAAARTGRCPGRRGRAALLARRPPARPPTPANPRRRPSPPPLARTHPRQVPGGQAGQSGGQVCRPTPAGPWASALAVPGQTGATCRRRCRRRHRTSQSRSAHLAPPPAPSCPCRAGSPRPPPRPACRQRSRSTCRPPEGCSGGTGNERELLKSSQSGHCRM